MLGKAFPACTHNSDGSMFMQTKFSVPIRILQPNQGTFFVVVLVFIAMVYIIYVGTIKSIDGSDDGWME